MSGDKADPRLREALESAPRERRLRTVMVLGGPGGEAGGGASEGGGLGMAGGGGATAPPDPKDYPDRTAWRQALIEHRKRSLGGEIGDVKRALADLGLEVKGGATSGAVVVEGAVEAVRAALDLAGVHHASLDREHRLVGGGNADADET